MASKLEEEEEDWSHEMKGHGVKGPEERGKLWIKLGFL